MSRVTSGHPSQACWSPESMLLVTRVKDVGHQSQVCWSLGSRMLVTGVEAFCHLGQG